MLGWRVFVAPPRPTVAVPSHHCSKIVVVVSIIVVLVAVVHNSARLIVVVIVLAVLLLLRPPHPQATGGLNAFRKLGIQGAPGLHCRGLDTEYDCKIAF